jgi:sialate O-acetylesterase
MVLQRNQSLPVWGWAAPKEKIRIELKGKSWETRADKEGKWMVRLDPQKDGGPYELIVQGKNLIKISDIYIGEVWICSGQSNMEMPIEGWGKISNFKQEIEAADFPQIRQFLVTKAVSTKPEKEIAGGEWKPCSPATAGDFTAVGYFFARELYRKLHVPIGLINSSWGGTMVETWISRGSFEKSDEFRDMITKMPMVDLAVLTREKTEAVQKKVIALQGSYEENANTANWKETDFDDHSWPHMKLPGQWEGQHLGLEDLDGLVWFRKFVNIEESDAGKPATLFLGKVDDSDDSYVNGTKVGEIKNKYNEPRVYQLSAGILKAGRNLIAVCVEDTGGEGGIFGEPEEMKLNIGDKTIPLNGDWLFRVEKIYAGGNNTGPNSFPTLLYNAMIHPLIPYAIKGAIWYQGETNAGRAFQYRRSFPLLINDWRNLWGEGDFPFYFVQLSSFDAAGGNSRAGSTWAELREAQGHTLQLPNTGMAVTTDIGDPKDIHPKDKQDVGKRLAIIALAKDYGQPVEFSGPAYLSMEKQGNKIILSFSHLGSGLVVKDKYGYAKGFEIAGNDHQFHWAKAYIDGQKLIVFSEEVPDPVAVHYGWADDAMEANLFNKEGFPASPFRTDDWKSVTQDKSYRIGD